MPTEGETTLHALGEEINEWVVRGEANLRKVVNSGHVVRRRVRSSVRTFCMWIEHWKHSCETLRVGVGYNELS